MTSYVQKSKINEKNTVKQDSKKPVNRKRKERLRGLRSEENFVKLPKEAFLPTDKEKAKMKAENK